MTTSILRAALASEWVLCDHCGWQGRLAAFGPQGRCSSCGSSLVRATGTNATVPLPTEAPPANSPHDLERLLDLAAKATPPHEPLPNGHSLHSADRAFFEECRRRVPDLVREFIVRERAIIEELNEGE